MKLKTEFMRNEQPSTATTTNKSNVVQKRKDECIVNINDNNQLDKKSIIKIVPNASTFSQHQRQQQQFHVQNIQRPLPPQPLQSPTNYLDHLSKGATNLVSQNQQTIPKPLDLSQQQQQQQDKKNFVTSSTVRYTSSRQSNDCGSNSGPTTSIEPPKPLQQQQQRLTNSSNNYNRANNITKSSSNHKIPQKPTTSANYRQPQPQQQQQVVIQKTNEKYSNSTNWLQNDGKTVGQQLIEQSSSSSSCTISRDEVAHLHFLPKIFFIFFVFRVCDAF